MDAWPLHGMLGCHYQWKGSATAWVLDADKVIEEPNLEKLLAKQTDAKKWEEQLCMVLHEGMAVWVPVGCTILVWGIPPKRPSLPETPLKQQGGRKVVPCRQYCSSVFFPCLSKTRDFTDKVPQLLKWTYSSLLEGMTAVGGKFADKSGYKDWMQVLSQATDRAIAAQTEASAKAEGEAEEERRA